MKNYYCDHISVIDASQMGDDTFPEIRMWEYEFLYGYLELDKKIRFEVAPRSDPKPDFEWDDRILMLIKFYSEVNLNLGLSLIHCPSNFDNCVAKYLDSSKEDDLSGVNMIVGHQYTEYYKYLCYGEIMVHYHPINDYEKSDQYKSSLELLLTLVEYHGYKLLEHDTEKRTLLLKWE
jgi:hypothetical protein